jgi:hypothetical protein
MTKPSMKQIIVTHARHGLRDGQHVCHAKDCPQTYPGAGYPTAEQVADHVVDVLEWVGYGEIVPEPQQTLTPAHQCESWQIRRGADGRKYCAACGVPQILTAGGWITAPEDEPEA